MIKRAIKAEGLNSNGFLNLVNDPEDILTVSDLVIPRDLRRLFQQTGYGAVSVDRKSDRSFRFFGIQIPIKDVVDMDFGEQGGNLILFPFGSDGHFDIFQGLAHLFQELNHVDGAAATQGGNYGLHGAHALIAAANLNSAVGLYRVAVFVGRHNIVGVVQSFKCDLHKQGLNSSKGTIAH